MTTVIDKIANAVFANPKHAPATLPECATCPGHCCKGDTILLNPDHGDVAFAYHVEEIEHPITGAPAYMLAHKPNGDCWYLDELDGVGRCTIYARRPVICRSFDCGKAFAQMPRHERRALVRDGLASKETFDMGRRVQERRKREAEALGSSPGAFNGGGG
jgi:hypothetical protein